jgi:hypothetical protein
MPFRRRKDIRQLRKMEFNASFSGSVFCEDSFLIAPDPEAFHLWTFLRSIPGCSYRCSGSTEKFNNQMIVIEGVRIQDFCIPHTEC